jgi:hypothetical protein
MLLNVVVSTIIAIAYTNNCAILAAKNYYDVASTTTIAIFRLNKTLLAYGTESRLAAQYSIVLK